MKTLHHILISCLCFAGFITGVHAQAELGLYTTSISNASPALGEQISIYTELRNNSITDTFAGPIDFTVANHDGIITAGSVIGKPPFTGTTVVLPPGAKMAALFTVQLQPAYFKVGPEIIIVWPITTSSPSTVIIVDSAKAPITITASTGIVDIPYENIKAFVYNEQLIIQTIEGKTSLEKVQIFDVVGTPVALYYLSDTDAIISLAALPKGLYIAEIMAARGQRKTIKFVR